MRRGNGSAWVPVASGIAIEIDSSVDAFAIFRDGKDVTTEILAANGNPPQAQKLVALYELKVKILHQQTLEMQGHNFYQNLLKFWENAETINAPINPASRSGSSMDDFEFDILGPKLLQRRSVTRELSCTVAVSDPLSNAARSTGHRNSHDEKDSGELLVKSLASMDSLLEQQEQVFGKKKEAKTGSSTPCLGQIRTEGGPARAEDGAAGPEVFSVMKRYSEFYALWNYLHRRYAEVPKLPQKTITRCFEPHHLESRREGLERFVCGVTSRRDIMSNKRVVAFFNCHRLLALLNRRLLPFVLCPMALPPASLGPIRSTAWASRLSPYSYLEPQIVLEVKESSLSAVSACWDSRLGLLLMGSADNAATSSALATMDSILSALKLSWTESALRGRVSFWRATKKDGPKRFELLDFDQSAAPVTTLFSCCDDDADIEEPRPPPSVRRRLFVGFADGSVDAYVVEGSPIFPANDDSADSLENAQPSALISCCTDTIASGSPRYGSNSSDRSSQESENSENSMQNIHDDFASLEGIQRTPTRWIPSAPRVTESLLNVKLPTVGFERGPPLKWPAECTELSVHRQSERGLGYLVPRHTEAVTAFAFDVERQLLFSAGRCVKILDIRRRVFLAEAIPHVGVTSMLLVARFLFTGCHDGSILVWDTHDLDYDAASVVDVDPQKPRAKNELTQVFSPSVKLVSLVSSVPERRISPEIIDLFKFVPSGHVSAIPALQVVAAAAGGDILLGTGSHDGTVAFWDVNFSPDLKNFISMSLLARIVVGTKVTAIAACEAAGWLAAGTNNGCVTLIAIRNFERLAVLKAHERSIKILQWDKLVLMTGSENGKVRWWRYKILSPGEPTEVFG